VLTINSPGTWRICSLSHNTYSGGTIISRGTLIWGATTNGASPDCSYALGTGPVTLNSGAMLQFEKASPTNALILNGGTLDAANSAGVTWLGPVTVNSNSTVRTDYGMGISGNVSGAGSLIKSGTDTLTLSGSNTYTGATLVQTGTLTCTAPASLAGGALSISNGAVVNLNYSGTRTIFSLTLGGTNKLAGVYGSSSSPATYPDAHFSGAGTVTVPVPVSISNLPAIFLATNKATLNASLGLSLGYAGTNATVLAYWNTINGETNAALWTNSAYVGKWSNIVLTNLACTVTSLTTNTTYYFTFLATNAAYTVWATNVLSFIMLPPIITGQPVSITNIAGSTAAFTLSASGATDYQWLKGAVPLSDGGSVSGSRTATLTLSRVGQADAGGYSVVVGNVIGSVTSAPANLTVIPPATMMWDANGSGAGVHDGGGTWLNPTNTWWNGSANVNWLDYNNAQIGAGGAGGTITLGAVTATLITCTNFTGTYTISNGTLTVLSNLTVANSAGAVVLNSVLGGPGGVTMNGSGSLSLYGLSANAYSGGTIINSGTLIWGTMTNGISPDCSYALGTGRVTLNSGATLQFQRANPTNALTLNGGTFYSQNGWGVTWSGPVTVNSNTTVRTDYGLVISGNLSGVGGCTKTGSATLTLSGNNTYSGATIVQTGTLSCSQAASLGSGALSISNGAVVNLNYSGTAMISALRLGGTNMLPGVYGSTNSPAANQNSHFSGTGTVTVPVISLANTLATGITSTSAALNAALGCTTTNATVLAYWNTVNGGNSAALWTNSAYVGSWTNQAATNLSYTAGGLLASTTYYFAFRATNLTCNVWATNALSFATAAPLTPPILGGVGPLSGTAFPLTFSGPSNQTYHVLRSTNLALPLSGWTTQSSGTFGASPVTCTDAGATNATQFYRIVSP